MSDVDSTRLLAANAPASDTSGEEPPRKKTKLSAESHGSSSIGSEDAEESNNQAHLSAVPATAPAPLTATIPLVDRRIFPNAPDPAQDLVAARAYAVQVQNCAGPWPTRGPLSTIGTSSLSPMALSAIEDHIFQGLKNEDCLPNYKRYGGNPNAKTGAAISKSIQIYAPIWFQEERIVTPWKALRREVQHQLKSQNLTPHNFPVVPYPPGTGAPPATYVPGQAPLPAPAPAPTRRATAYTRPSSGRARAPIASYPENDSESEGLDLADPDDDYNDPASIAAPRRGSNKMGNKEKASHSDEDVTSENGTASQANDSRSATVEEEGSDVEERALDDRLPTGVTIHDYIRALIDTYDRDIEHSNTVFDNEDDIVVAEMSRLLGPEGGEAGPVYNLRTRSGRKVKAFTNSYSSIIRGGPFNGLPTHIVSYSTDKAEENYNRLRPEALKAVPIRKDPNWLWQQYLLAKDEASASGRDKVLDEFYRRYCEVVESRQNGHGNTTPGFYIERKLLEDLDREDPLDKPMWDFLIDVLVFEGHISLGDPTDRELAEEHGPIHNCLAHATRAEFCDRYHTHGETACYQSFSPKIPAEYDASYLYRKVAPFRFAFWRPDDGTKEAVERLLDEEREVFAAIQAERLQRVAARLSTFLIYRNDLTTPIGKESALAYLKNDLDSELEIHYQDIDRWIEVLVGYVEEMEAAHNRNPLLYGTLEKIRAVLALFYDAPTYPTFLLPR